MPNAPLYQAQARLARISVPLPAVDPWALSEALEPLFGAAVAHWCDPKGGLTFCAWGVALAQVLPDRGRFDAARNALARLQQGSITSPTPPGIEGPVALCGMAFEDGACGRPGPFAALHGGLLVVPSCFVLRQEGHGPGAPARCWAVLQVLRAPGEGAVGPLEDLAAAVREAVASVGRGAPAPQGAGVQLPAEAAAAQDSFVEQVAQAQRALGPGLTKVVLARARGLEVALDPAATLWALRQQHPTATCFRLTLPDGEHFAGATPETLVRLHEGVLTTEALAGTAPRGTDAAGDEAAAAALLASAKDRAEHDAVVQGLTQALGPLTERLALAPEPQAVALKQMWHLQTPVRAEVRPGQDALTLAAALHPTPALGGQPTAAATAYLRQHEPWRRGLYAAPLGWLSLSGDGVFVAGIRSLWHDAQRAQLFAGAGIVAQSSPLKEWQETALKLSTAAHGLRRPSGQDPEEPITS